MVLNCACEVQGEQISITSNLMVQTCPIYAGTRPSTLLPKGIYPQPRQCSTPAAACARVRSAVEHAIGGRGQSAVAVSASSVLSATPVLHHSLPCFITHSRALSITDVLYQVITVCCVNSSTFAGCEDAPLRRRGQTVRRLNC